MKRYGRGLLVVAMQTVVTLLTMTAGYRIVMAIESPVWSAMSFLLLMACWLLTQVMATRVILDELAQ